MMKSLVGKLRKMAADRSLPIGEAWNALDEAAAALEQAQARLRTGPVRDVRGKRATFNGWAGKAGSWWFWERGNRELLVFRERGRRVEWEEDDWPPVRVRVTIEALPRRSSASVGRRTRRKGRRT
jgi:hypothetical protein